MTHVKSTAYVANVVTIFVLHVVVRQRPRVLDLPLTHLATSLQRLKRA
jgi:hypothetical protein